VRGHDGAVVEPADFLDQNLLIRVTQADPATLEERGLRARNVDLMLGRFSSRVPAEDIAAEFLFDEIPYVVAGAGNKWLNRRKIELAELFGENWVLPPGDSITGSLIEAAFRAAGVGLPHATVVTFSLQFAISLLTTGRFLGIVPGSMLRFAGKRLGIKVLPLALPIRPGPVGVTTLKNRTLSPVAELFIDHARQLAASMGPAR
jgi:DNA-binding transcriptional LysR family regulator